MSETLKYIRLEERVGVYEITVQTSGGSIYVHIPRGSDDVDVCNALRTLADRLAYGVLKREGYPFPPPSDMQKEKNDNPN